MSRKNDILESIKQHISTRYDMPDITINGIQYNDKVAQFIEISKTVGGNASELKNADLNSYIKELYPEAKTIASNLDEITIATINPDNVDSPHSLNGVDLAIVKGEIAVAENGAVWIPQNVKEKVIYFIAEYLVILIDKKNIVNNMHEAYNKIEFNDSGFGLFISGPSKTADIEQALVVGAHGARGLNVIILDK